MKKGEIIGKNRVWHIKEEYDSLTGDFAREIRSNDIVNLVGSVTASTLVASTKVSSSFNYYPYIFRASSASTTNKVVLLNNSTTLAILSWTANNYMPQIVTDPDRNPIAKITPSSTIKIKTATAGTTVAMLVCKRVPINSKFNV